jgi:hypothetical protein
VVIKFAAVCKIALKARAAQYNSKSVAARKRDGTDNCDDDYGGGDGEMACTAQYSSDMLGKDFGVSGQRSSTRRMRLPRIVYYCEVHSKTTNINLGSIEQHCKILDPDHHKTEIISRLHRRRVGMPVK